MRRRRPQPPTTTTPPDGAAALPQAYDWTQFGRHRLRAADGAIIDLPVPVGAGRHVWVATMWPDPHVDGGWARALWQPHPTTGRGWRIPLQLAAGDVLEFGADTPQQPVRWYGIMDSYEVDRWATVQGPYPHPAAAYEEAQRLLALERYVPPLESEAPRPVEPCRRTHRDRRRRRHRRP